MEARWALVAYGLITIIVVASLLCGQWPIFHGTIVQRINHFITFWAYDYFLRFVSIIYGSRGTNIILAVEHYYCDRPNPILQLFYLGILGMTYGIIVNSSFRYIPSYYVSEYHRYLSMLVIAVGILFFVLTSFSDPGTVNIENVSNYMSVYLYDNVIYVEKDCQTCKIPKPARSKHCGICGRCIARFDHHCGWMNNCIGEKNTRYFLAFLFWHLAICIYGAAILGLILAGRLEEQKLIYILTVYYNVEKSFSGLFLHIVQWLNPYNTEIFVMAFLLIISLLLAWFFGYHALLCLTNTTTNEAYKWQDYISWKQKVNEAAALWSFPQRSLLQNSEVQEVVKNNMYDKGVFCNVGEIIFPLSERPSFLHKKAS